MWWMKFLCVTVLLWQSHSVAFAGDDADAVISKLQKKYDTVNDASIAFTQSVQFAVTKNEQSFSGTLLMKKGNKYRIEMEEQTIVTDGVCVWSFNKINNQVFSNKYQEDPKSFSPDKVLTNLPEKYSSTWLGKEKLGGQDLTIVKLVPKQTK